MVTTLVAKKKWGLAENAFGSNMESGSLFCAFRKNLVPVTEDVKTF